MDYPAKRLFAPVESDCEGVVAHLDKNTTHVAEPLSLRLDHVLTFFLKSGNPRLRTCFKSFQHGP